MRRSPRRPHRRPPRKLGHPPSRPAHEHLLDRGVATTFESAQYTSLTYTDRLDELGIAPSVGSKGDAYDNAMAEAWVATFKSELVDGRRFPSFEHAEHEVLDWIGFYNDQRLHEALGDVPPAEYEDEHRSISRQTTPQWWPPPNRASNRPQDAGMFAGLSSFFTSAAIFTHSSLRGNDLTAFSGANAVGTPTTDMSGSLRLVRASATLTAYYRSGTATAWTELLSAAANPGYSVAGIGLQTPGAAFGHNDASVAFDNFRLNSGTLTCPPWWVDSAPDWQAPATEIAFEGLASVRGPHDSIAIVSPNPASRASCV